MADEKRLSVRALARHLETVLDTKDREAASSGEEDHNSSSHGSNAELRRDGHSDSGTVTIMESTRDPPRRVDFTSNDRGGVSGEAMKALPRPSHRPQVPTKPKPDRTRQSYVDGCITATHDGHLQNRPTHIMCYPPDPSHQANTPVYCSENQRPMFQPGFGSTARRRMFCQRHHEPSPDSSPDNDPVNDDVFGEDPFSTVFEHTLEGNVAQETEGTTPNPSPQSNLDAVDRFVPSDMIDAVVPSQFAASRDTIDSIVTSQFAVSCDTIDWLVPSQFAACHSPAEANAPITSATTPWAGDPRMQAARSAVDSLAAQCVDDLATNNAADDSWPPPPDNLDEISADKTDQNTKHQYVSPQQSQQQQQQQQHNQERYAESRQEHSWDEIIKYKFSQLHPTSKDPAAAPATTGDDEPDTPDSWSVAGEQGSHKSLSGISTPAEDKQHAAYIFPAAPSPFYPSTITTAAATAASVTTLDRQDLPVLQRDRPRSLQTTRQERQSYENVGLLEEPVSRRYSERVAPHSRMSDYENVALTFERNRPKIKMPPSVNAMEEIQTMAEGIATNDEEDPLDVLEAEAETDAEAEEASAPGGSASTEHAAWPAPEIVRRPASIKRPQRHQYENVVIGPFSSQIDADNTTHQTSESNSAKSQVTSIGEKLSAVLLQMVNPLPPPKTEGQEEDEAESSSPDLSGTAESDDSYFSDSDFDDEIELQELSDDQMSMLSGVIPESDDTKCNTNDVTSERAHDIARQMAQTEKSYVERLHFLCRVVMLNLKVLSNVQDVHPFPPEVMYQVFGNLETIFAVHSERLLPRIESRLASWEVRPGMGDILKDSVGSFKLYVQYTENMNRATLTFDHWMNKQGVFHRLIKEVERTPECGRLSVKQHLLDVVHRVPKYHAACKEYLEHLPVEAGDRKDTEDAVESLTEVVRELERAMGKDERMKKLREVQQRLDKSYRVVSASRELLREGKINTVSPKSGQKFPRYIFLFNDMLLLCTTAGFGGSHSIRVELNLDGMQIHEGDNLLVGNTFYVQTRRKALEFTTATKEQKQQWVKAIREAIDEFTNRKLSGQPLRSQSQEEAIGRLQPPMVELAYARLCKLCSQHLGKNSRKKQNCSACGRVLCVRCCSKKAKLEWDSNRWNRVCDECYITLRNRELDMGEQAWKHVEVALNDDCLISGSMQLSADNGRSWKKRWFMLTSAGNLCCFKDKTESIQSSLPVKRFSVSLTSKGDSFHKSAAFTMHNNRRTYILQTDSADTAQRWVQMLANFGESSA